jgi:hypothetical protein
MKTNSRTFRKRATSQRGMSMVLALLVVLMLTGAGLGLMYMSITETGVNNNFRSTLQAYYASKAGLDEARDRLRGNPNAIAAPIIMPDSTKPGGVIYILNSDGTTAVTPWVSGSKYFDDELCHENFTGLTGVSSPGPNIPCGSAPGGTYYTTVTSTDPNTGTAAAVPYKWVRITMKQSGSTQPYCVDGAPATGGCTNNGTMVCADAFGNEVLKPNSAGNCEANNWEPVYSVTSLAMTITNARRITQQEIAQVVLPPLPGGLVLDGASPNVDIASSNNYFVNGHNANSCNANPPAADIPSVGVVNNTDVSNVSNGIPNKRQNNYTGSGSGIPDVENVYNSLGQLETVGGLETLVTAVTNIADQVVASGATPTLGLGSDTNPLVTVIQGDYSGDCTGSGILLVTGYLTCNGKYTFDGVILVIGVGSFAASNGGGNGVINGGLFVANITNQCNDPKSCAHIPSPIPSADLLPTTSNPGIPYVNWNGGGTNGIQYDSCWTRKLNSKVGFRVLTSREEMY